MPWKKNTQKIRVYLYTSIHAFHRKFTKLATLALSSNSLEEFSVIFFFCFKLFLSIRSLFRCLHCGRRSWKTFKSLSKQSFFFHSRWGLLLEKFVFILSPDALFLPWRRSLLNFSGTWEGYWWWAGVLLSKLVTHLFATVAFAFFIISCFDASQ